MIKQSTDKKGQHFVVQAYSTNKWGQSVRRRRKLYTSSKAAAKKLERELIEELSALKSGFNLAGMTYNSFLIKEFYPHCDEHFPTEYHNLYMTLNKWCKPIMELRIETINPTDIRGIIDKVSDEVTTSTARKIRSFINRSFEFAKEFGLQSNPTEPVKIDKKNCKEYQQMVLTNEEVKILLTQSKILKPYYHKVWALSLFLGTRISELIALLRQDCDLDQQIISVSKSYSKRLKTDSKIKQTKTGKWRKIPIADNLMPMMRELMVGPKHEPLIKANHVLLKGDQSRVLKEFCIGIGITPVTQHALRATHITQLFASGATIAQVQSIVGHSSLSTTQIYLRASGVTVKGVTNCLDFTLPSEKINNVVNMFG
jgi:integrase